MDVKLSESPKPEENPLMKPRSQMLDFSFRQNEQHILADILEYALIIVITMIAITATTSILNDQVTLMF